MSTKQTVPALRDKRLIDRNLGKGLLKSKDIEGYLKGLPDDANNAQWVTLDMHDAEIGDSQTSGNDEGT